MHVEKVSTVKESFLNQPSLSKTSSSKISHTNKVSSRRHQAIPSARRFALCTQRQLQAYCLQSSLFFALYTA